MLRSVVLLLVLLSSPIFVQSQDLVDVEFISTTGETHAVFDILDEGKPIVFYFFFVDCPICVSTTPPLVDLYNEFGGNDGCFEIMAMGVANDDVQAMDDYAESYGATFPRFTREDNPFILPLLTSHFEGISIGSPAVLVFAPDRSKLYEGTGFGVISEGPLSTLVSDNTDLLCAVASGINDVNQKVSMFPNPLQADAPLHLSLEYAGEYLVTVLDQSGKVVQRFEKTLEQDARLDLDELNAGVYFLSLESDDLRSVSKFVRL